MTTATLTREARAALATFLTMSYILFVNPAILGEAIKIADVSNLPMQLMAATALAAAAGCFVMGLWAKYPFALAPGMGLNAFFSYSVVLGSGFSWQQALAFVFVSGLLFLVLTASGLRDSFLHAIPHDLKMAMTVGIGLFLALIGCKQGGLVVASPATLVTLGNLHSPEVLLTLLGLFITGLLLAKDRHIAIVSGIFVVSAVAYFVLDGVGPKEGAPYFVAWPTLPIDLIAQFDFSAVFTSSGFMVLVAFLFVDFFDTAGTLIGVSERAGFLDAEGRLARAGRAFMADAVATTIGAVLGSSPTTTYIESASGVAAGGRTGLTAVIVGGLFLVALFFWPLLQWVPAVATAPALIAVGALMMMSVTKIDWQKFQIALPAFATIIGMPFTYSISTGIALGLVFYTALALAMGAYKKEELPMYGLAVIIALFAVIG